MEAQEELRPYLFAIAYRMLGSVAEAEDVVQEAFLRYHAAGAEREAESPKAYLATITTRLAIDELRSARARREVYPGEWLPEPLVEDEAARHAEMSDSLSLTFLHLLEKLSPVERVVFLLGEVFDYPYHEVAGIVGKSPANTRQILSRAPRPHQRGAAPLRRLAPRARRGRAPVPGGLGGGRHRRPDRSARPGRHRLWRRRRQGAGCAGATRRRRARGEGAHRLAPPSAEAPPHAPPGARERRPGNRLLQARGPRALGRRPRDRAEGVVVAVRSIVNPDKLTHVAPL
jgi:RNA polymerase sigma-70 factor, ECF subfamily